MRQATGKMLRDSSILISAAELGEVIGADLETINNWIRRDIINRTPIGGRQLRNRLFSAEEVCKAALKNELVKLGIPPSEGSEAVNTLWKAWDKRVAPEEQNIYALMFPSKDKWTVTLCSRKSSGGPLYKLGRSTTKSTEEVEFPKQAFAVIPISDIFDRISNKLSGLLPTDASSR